MSLFRAPMVVVDTETTGLPSKHPFAEAVEFAAVLLDADGNEVDTWSSLIRPAYTGPEIDGALAVNHITREQLFSQLPAAGLVPSILGWLDTHGGPYVTAFNVAFDREICDRMGLRSLRWASCVMQRAMGIMGPAGVLRPANPHHPAFDERRPWLFPKLSDAAAFFGVTVDGDAHRALTDARTAARVAVAIRRRELGMEQGLPGAAA
jgi:DNA polymerase III epsilon subunit-like protein